MPRQPDNWPAGALPRGLDLAQAAYYVGLSPTTFLTHIENGIFPKPLVFGRRKVWDRYVLDRLLDAKSGFGDRADNFFDPVGQAAALEDFLSSRQSPRKGKKPHR